MPRLATCIKMAAVCFLTEASWFFSPFLLCLVQQKIQLKGHYPLRNALQRYIFPDFQQPAVYFPVFCFWLFRSARVTSPAYTKWLMMTCLRRDAIFGSLGVVRMFPIQQHVLFGSFIPFRHVLCAASLMRCPHSNFRDSGFYRSRRGYLTCTR